MEGIEGRAAIVTGASRGIGREIAVQLAGEGARVCVGYVRNRDEAEETVRRVTAAGGTAFAVGADLSDPLSVKRLVSDAEASFGTVDILVNNAGVVHKDALERIAEADWDRVININLKSAFLLTQACLPGMRRNKWGRIIFISSVAAQTGGVTGPVYCASKAGMLGLMRSYAALLVKEGITANAVAPALIDLTVDSSKIPLGRFGTVSEVAQVVVTLAKNGYVTGQTFNVNGGWYFS
jgi:3-oxoacyl-[acyl-carrier protein] reductase